MRGACVLLLWVVGCGGHEPAPSSLDNHGGPAPQPFSVELVRGQCMGRCPAYTVQLRDDGTVRWKGEANVAVTAERTGHVEPAQIEKLRDAFRAARFMELNDGGKLPRGPQCHKLADGSQECEGEDVTMCSDTSHAKLTVVMDGKTHATDDSHCGGEDALVRLEDLVDQTAGTGAWITGPQVPLDAPATP
jgi:hypothetical protein